ncbi:SHQ1 protein-domain-containing protein [Lentinula aciculospora]|uniref:SHQ1 protein-domain-containing protein n=1 Tax=Lentinula aciculospora TaxID=153920 RepID=A0A9W9ART0_9AGAR|nr:SHQ1 protein-domain-containing protein [Lentinula aciculospora]
MITPRFSCSQTAESVIISVYCPSVRASDVEINVDSNLFSLHINPYFLRLNFTNSLTEDDASSAQYDPSTGYLTVTLTKGIKGQEFKDLDLLAKLLAPRPTVHEPLIEVISSESTAEDPDQLVAQTQNLTLQDRDILEAVKYDWQLPQEVSAESPTLRVGARYGFLDLYSGYFTNVTYTENEVNELRSEAETLTLLERRQRRIQHEDEKWDEEYYMADFADDEYIRELIGWTHPYLSDSNTFAYTEKENATMLNLPRKECVLPPAVYDYLFQYSRTDIPTKSQTHSLYLTLTTVLFSYAYDARTTQHEPTPESAWTICSLTPSFSALDYPPYHGKSGINSPILEFTLDEISASFVPSYRRSLAFPLYRSFVLAEKCRQDVANFLLKGPRTVVRCLMEMKDIMDHHDVYYVYSKVWLDDLCVWTQAYASEETLTHLGNLVRDASITKKSIGWELEQLENFVVQLQAGDQREVDSDDE